MRMFLLIVFLFLVACIAFQAYRTYGHIRVARVLVAEAVPFEHGGSEGGKRILMVGDSTGAGVGAGAPEESLAGLVGKKYLGASIVNRSVSGARLLDVIEQLKKNDPKFFDLILVHVGGNDITHFTSHEEFRARLKSVLNLAQGKGTNVLVTSTGNMGTAPLLPPLSRPIFTHRTRKAREIFLAEITHAGNPNVRYTDLFRERDQDPFALQPKVYYAADSFHPSDAGYRDWFHLMSNELDAFAL